MFLSRVDRALLCALAIASAAQVSAQDPQDLSPRVERDVARELACSPQAPLIEPTATIRVAAGQERGKMQFAKGETVIVNAGRGQGLSAGQQYFVAPRSLRSLHRTVPRLSANQRPHGRLGPHR